jgi:hypothetical protein
MILKPDNFVLQELVCPDVFKQYGEFAWNFFDPRLLITLDRIRAKLNKRIFINNWQDDGNYSQRGLRCLICPIVKGKYNTLYESAHMVGKGVDFDVEGLLAEEVRLWIAANKNIWPYPIRLERDVEWVHLDLFDMDNDQKVYLFKA